MTRAARKLCALLSLLVSLLSVGCTGRGQVNFISLNMAEIDPPQAGPWSFHAGEAYWWIDETNQLNIALRHHKANILLGRLVGSDLVLTFVFDSPPAGRARNYHIMPRDVRALFTSGVTTQRFNASNGIVGVTIGKDRVLRGSFRLWMMPLNQVSLFSFLPQRPGSLLCYGAFEAVENANKGAPVIALSEASGYTRPKRMAASQPVAR